MIAERCGNGRQATAPSPGASTLSIIIPVFNEVRTIERVIRRVITADLPHGVAREVLVVDDGSTDGTTAVLRRLQTEAEIRVYELGRHQGKSEAVRAGLVQATGDIVVLQDADLEYDPIYLIRLLTPILEGRAAIVFGSRFQGRIRRMAPLTWLANRWSTLTVNVLFRTRLTDVNTGYKMLRRELLACLRVTAEDFGYDAEMTAKLLRRDHHIVEVPINYTGRTRQEGKKMTWPSAIHMYLCFIWHRFAHDDQPA